MLIAALSACLLTLRLNDYARVVARTAATSTEINDVIEEGETLCKCDLQISVDADVVTVRASRHITFPIIGLPLTRFRLSAESFAIKEPAVVFEAPTTP